jgi:L-fuculokinase
MTSLPVVAIFDIGKTNKKSVLFDKDYNLVHEEEITIPLIADEDGYPCDDLEKHIKWIIKTLDSLLAGRSWNVKALNFSTFGAAMVHIDKDGEPLTPLYSYLKPIDQKTTESFYSLFGDRHSFSHQTGAPALNMLNSGVQLFWLKKNQPEVFKKFYCSLHLPQFLSYLFTKNCQADITSIGCHTGMWDMHKKKYHDWLGRENMLHLLPEPEPFNTCRQINYKGNKFIAGIGLHDSSATLLPFTLTSTEPFAILSTGTWNITLIPGFTGEISKENYERDCLYYLLGKDQPVAASRIFLGNEFEYQLKKLNNWFQKNDSYYLSIKGDREMLQQLIEKNNYAMTFIPETMQGSGPYPALKGNGADLNLFHSFEEAYHKLVLDSAWLQKESIGLLLSHSLVKKIYVTGGFVKNQLFMDMLQNFFPGIQFHTVSINNGTALGAALALHEGWNKGFIKDNFTKTIKCKTSLHLDISHYKFPGIFYKLS